MLTTPVVTPGLSPAVDVPGARDASAVNHSAGPVKSASGAEPDTVEISAEAEAYLSGRRGGKDESDARLVGNLSPAQRRQVTELKSRDREVRAHEAAHQAAAGALARGGASFDYQIGPDGQRYAVGGEVSIDTSPVPDDPEATIRKAQVVRAAALAPAKPSGQDRAVAAAVARMQSQAQRDLATAKADDPALSVESAADAADPTTSSGNVSTPAESADPAASSHGGSSEVPPPYDLTGTLRTAAPTGTRIDAVA